MAPAELPHRAWRALAAQAERCGLAGDARAPQANLAAAAPRWLRVAAMDDPSACLAAAARAARGRFDLFELRDRELGPIPRWNRDPKSGVEAPPAFGKTIDYRDPRQVGDIKYLWELNRHGHLVTLAQAYALGGGPEPALALRAQLESWLDQCPFRIGPNWSSALEVAFRLLHWAAAWQLLGGLQSPLFAGDGAAFRDRWLRSVHQHARFVRGFLSLHSSANNHLVGEAAGLQVAGLTWPHWRESRRWAADGMAILARETLRQNAPDGVNREQAVSYQQFVLDLLLVAIAAGRANGLSFPPAVLARIEAMLEYLACIMDARGHVPMIGDSDDVALLPLAPAQGFCRYRSVLAAGALLFGRGDFLHKAGGIDHRTRCLYGTLAMRAPPECAAPPARRAFPDGGQYVLGGDFESGREIRLVADAGPLGYLGIAAHGHADALSFTLSVGGLEMLVDPGTYAYHAEPGWRGYFRGTSAHNTLCVDGLDQSEPGGNFLWLRKAQAECLAWRSETHTDLLEAAHDGYLRLADPVLHRRRLRLDRRTRHIGIEDELQTSGAHEVELFFHCDERCVLERQGDGFLLRRNGVRLFLRPPPGECRVVQGGTRPVLGWVSRRFGEKTPSPTIAWRARLEGGARLHTEIVC
jgi:hypothetical protein